MRGKRAEKQEQVACDYLNSLPAEELFTPENWELIVANVKDPLAKPSRTLMKEVTQYNVFRDLKRERYYLVTCVESVKATRDEVLIDDCQNWLEKQATQFGGSERGRIFAEMAGRLQQQVGRIR